MRTLTICLAIAALITANVSAQNIPSACWTTSVGSVTSFDTSVSRGAANNYLLWDNGATIKVAFLNGSLQLQSKIMTAAKTWEKYANIKFKQVPSAESHVRIDLTPGNGNKSLVGIESKMADPSEPTMWLDSTESLYAKAFQAMVLHEFGHVLGLLHEMQHPNSGINWNKQKIYEEYSRHCGGWPGTKCDYENMFTKHSQFYTNGTSYDNKSIMHYPIPAWMTLDGYKTDWNLQLSEGDKQIISKLYPKNMVRENEVLRTDFVLKGSELIPSGEGFIIRSRMKVTANREGEVYVVNFHYDKHGDPIQDDNELYQVNGTVATYKKIFLKKTPAGGEEVTIDQYIPYSEALLKEGQDKVYFATVVYHDAKEAEDLRRVYGTDWQELPLVVKTRPALDLPAAGDVPSISRILPITPVMQQTRVWCWLAVGEMLLRYYGVPNANPYGNYQCGIIGSIMPAGSPCSSNCFNNQCVIPSGSNANTIRMLIDYTWLASRKSVGFYEGYELSFAGVRNNIDAGRPVVCGISPVRKRYYNDAEHAVLLTGYDLSSSGAFVIINDPFDYSITENPYLAAGATMVSANQYKVLYSTFVSDLFWHWSLSNINI